MAVNKMDAVDFSEERFAHIKKELAAVLKKAGFNPDKVSDLGLRRFPTWYGASG